MIQLISAIFAQGQSGQGGGLLIFGYVLIFMAMMYLLMIRPQQRRDKERKLMLENLKKGNKVMFSGGIVGQIVGVKDKDNLYIVKIADNVKIDIHRDAVNAVIDQDQSVDEAASKSSSS